MAKQVINNGTTAGDGTGENLHDAFQKVNENFDEVYGFTGWESKTDTVNIVSLNSRHRECNANHSNVSKQWWFIFVRCEL